MRVAATAWRPSKVKFLARYINGYAFKPADWSESGKPILRIQNLSDPTAPVNRYEGELDADLLVREGDLLISWSASLGAYEWQGEESWLNQHIFKVVLNRNLVRKDYFKWLSIWFMTELSSEAHGSTMQHLTKDRFGSFKLVLPPFEQQETIARYLRAETAQIDTLITDKERMLALLGEKRAAQISRAVTCGINPDAPLEPSGLAWLGDIPRHWETKRSKRVFIERDDRSETGEEEMLTVSHLTGVTPRSEKDVNMFEAESNEGYKLVSPDNLVINTLWAWMGAMGVARHEGIVSPAYHVYRITNDLLPDYVDYLVRTDAFKAEVMRFSKGVWSSRLRLYPEGLYEVWLPIPPLPEQRVIVAHLKAERERTAELEAALRGSVELLQERRRALITAAVTGQIEPGAMTA